MFLHLTTESRVRKKTHKPLALFKDTWTSVRASELARCATGSTHAELSWDETKAMDKDTSDGGGGENGKMMITTKVTLSSLECKNLSPKAFAKNK